MKKWNHAAVGLLFVLTLSIFAKELSLWVEPFLQMEALTIAIILGILYNNLIGTQQNLLAGVNFALKKLLKIGIVLLGFKLNLQVLWALGPKIIILVVTYVATALMLSWLVGKMLKLPPRLATLLGVGSCICGASAVVAMAPCIDAEEEDSVLAVSVVSFLGAIGVLIYSAIAVANDSITPVQYGVWSGLSLHGVAHAIAAAFAMGDQAGEIGTLVKMARVLMLVPVSLGLSFLYRKEDGKSKRAGFPFYVLYFILAGIINTMGVLPGSMVGFFGQMSNWLILMAMTAMGLMVDGKSLVKRGAHAGIAGIVIFGILSLGSYLIITAWL
ncbi:YeiH family protein [Gottschalkiaceae bacterium SANA]|nr:YeiH family protein [Gottschalkiaceae bacterium SANA]